MNLNALLPVPSNSKVEEFRAGDTVRINLRVIEGNRERVQTLDGVVIRRHRAGIGSTFTIRRVTRGIGIELTYPLHSPRLESVSVLRRGHVRRARLYYLRGRFGKAARIREGRGVQPQAQVQPAELSPSSESVQAE
ncbi:MAG: 50S ribosomal protein L19 [Chloroflexi bacterium]|nr:50S ribosomal protein L19 [Chloroflexota bacterium]